MSTKPGQVHTEVRGELVTSPEGEFHEGASLGGLIGYNRGDMDNVTNAADITGAYGLGGIVGDNSGTIRDAENFGTIRGMVGIGGILGGALGGELERARNVGDVLNTLALNADPNDFDSESATGGIAGFGGKMKHVVNEGRVIGGNHTGGIAGTIWDGSVLNSRNDGDVEGTNAVGGIVGFARLFGAEGTFNTADVVGVSKVGGIVGKARDSGPSAKHVYNVGDVHGDRQVGGIVGDGEANPEFTYNAGSVKGTDDVGGISGSGASIKIKESYFDIDAQPEGATMVDSAEYGKTNKEMTTATTYADWPDDVWIIQDGQYPDLIANPM